MSGAQGASPSRYGRARRGRRPARGRAPLDNWAEPLEDNFARVLAENLSLLLTTDQMAVFPWKSPMSIEYQVVVEVTKFLGEPGGQASLEALWSIVGKNGTDVRVMKKSSFTEPVGAQNYEALAAAMSRTVAALSRDIATRSPRSPPIPSIASTEVAKFFATLLE